MTKQINISPKAYSKIMKKKNYLQKKFKRKRVTIPQVVDVMLEV